MDSSPPPSRPGHLRDLQDLYARAKHEDRTRRRIRSDEACRSALSIPPCPEAVVSMVDPGSEMVQVEDRSTFVAIVSRHSSMTPAEVEEAISSRFLRSIRVVSSPATDVTFVHQPQVLPVPVSSRGKPRRR